MGQFRDRYLLIPSCLVLACPSQAGMGHKSKAKSCGTSSVTEFIAGMRGGGAGPDAWDGAQKVMAVFLPPRRFNLRSGRSVQFARAEHNTLTARRVGQVCSPQLSGSGLALP
jgi:hypothetical protein